MRTGRCLWAPCHHEKETKYVALRWGHSRTHVTVCSVFLEYFTSVSNKTRESTALADLKGKIKVAMWIFL